MIRTSTPVFSAPIITIYVRHHKDCSHSDDHFYKGRGCNCRKRLRWTQGGKRRDVSAKTRSWAEAEKTKQGLLERFQVASPASVRVETESRRTINRAIELFLQSKRNEDVSEAVIKKYDRELDRFKTFMEKRGKFFPGEITSEDLTEFQAGWAKLYPSSQTRSRVLTRYRAFLRYCMDSDWIEKMPKFDKVRLAEVPTLPLTAQQYKKVLAVISERFTPEKARKVRALVQLMRHSGLSIRDAVVLERAELKHDKRKDLYRVTTSRQKTGTDVNVLLPREVSDELLAVTNDNPKYFFWNTGTGKPQSAVTNWQHDLRDVFRSAGMPDGHPHQLRDSFAVGLLEKGVPLEEVSKALGHESIKTTEKHYAAWVRGRQERLDSLVMGTWD